MAFLAAMAAKTCTCYASFPTTEDLETHLSEYRSREIYLKSELEKCLTHSSVPLAQDTLNEDRDASSESREKTIQPTTSNRLCPYEGCSRAKPFATRKELRIHYRKHVECNEVCVYCHEVFRLASAYLRHVHCDPIADSSKSSYMAQRRNMVTDHVDKELGAAENKSGSKRTASDTEIGPREVKRARVIDTGSAPNGQHHRSAEGHSTAGEAVLTQTGGAGLPVLDSAAGAVYSVDGASAAGLDNFDDMAPVNMVINLPPVVHPAWPGWIWDANTIGSTSGEIDFFSNGSDGVYAPGKSIMQASSLNQD